MYTVILSERFSYFLFKQEESYLGVLLSWRGVIICLEGKRGGSYLSSLERGAWTYDLLVRETTFQVNIFVLSSVYQTKFKMVSFIQKSCCNFSRFSIASTTVFMPKISLIYPQRSIFVLNAFESKRHIHIESAFSNLLTPGVGHRRRCAKWIHTTQKRRGIEEFFPPGILENPQPLPEEVQSGKGLIKIVRTTHQLMVGAYLGNPRVLTFLVQFLLLAVKSRGFPDTPPPPTANH